MIATEVLEEETERDELDLQNHEDPTIVVLHSPPPPPPPPPQQQPMPPQPPTVFFHKRGRLPSIEEELDEDLDGEVFATNPMKDEFLAKDHPVIGFFA